MSLSPPVQITVPFATGGLKNAIPAAANPTDGHAGYDVGFPAINMTPKTAGGIPPFGQDFNGIFFEVSTALQYLEAGGSFPYSSTFSTAVGGYPLGAIVSRTDGTGLWRNTVANNTTNPETFGVGWQPEDAGSTAVTMTNANVTLTALQAARSIINITGVLTANLNLILPTYSKQWLVANNCTGAFTITVKTAAGSGASVTPGTSRALYGDGTNIIEYSSGRLIGVQTFSAGGTYTPTPGTNSVIVDMIGGGGGGGGVPATGAGQLSTGGGGGGGSRATARFTTGFSGLSVTIGSAGAGGAIGAGGTAGGQTSFGAILLAAGGGGGGQGPAASVPPFGVIGGTGGSLPSLGNILNMGGQPGSPATAFVATSFLSGSGGNSCFGGGGGRGLPTSTAAGNPAVGAGAGGGGAANGASSAGQVGGNGGAGFAIVYEYA